jgi:hypothetical protein
MCKVNRHIVKVLLVSSDAKVDSVSSTPLSCAEYEHFFLFNKYSLPCDVQQVFIAV